MAATVRAPAVPVLEGARELAEAGQIPGGSKRNRRYVEPSVRFAEDVDEVTRALLADAQTSGGMLIACPPEQLGSLRDELAARATPFYEVGVVTEGRAGEIAIEL